MEKQNLSKISPIDSKVGESDIKEAPSKEFFGKLQDLVSKNTPKFVDDLDNEKDGKKTKELEKKTPVEAGQTEKLYTVSDLTKNLTPKKIIKLVLLLLLLVMIIAAVYVRFIGGPPAKKVPILVNVPTPTYSPYQKYKPSIYADDPNFKKLDEGINVLENELKNIVFEEKSLLPPTLDYEVIFE